MMKKYRVKLTGFKFGVPTTFIVDNYNAEQFRLVNVLNHYPVIYEQDYPVGTYVTAVNGKINWARAVLKFR